MKKAFFSLAVTLLFVTFFSVSASAIEEYNYCTLSDGIHFNSGLNQFDSSREVVDYGECGLDEDIIEWILYDDGELVITGEGEIDIYLDDYPYSWDRCADKVKKITIDYGMTYMGSGSFCKCINLTSITIPSSITDIAEYSFSRCDKLTDVYFVGTQEQWSKIDIYDDGNGNDNLLNATLHFVDKCEHSDTTDYAQQNATCDKVGFTSGEYCNNCKMWVSGHKIIPTLPHSYESVIIPATLTSKGKTEYICSCGDTYIEIIPQIDSVTLSKTNYIYDGKNKTPKVTVTDIYGDTLVKNVDYKISVASKRSGIGRYTVKVTFMGNYSGSKSVYFYIKPGKTASVKSVSQTTSSVKLSWSAVDGASGYTVYRYSPSKKAYVKAGTTEGTSLTVKSLYAGTKYTFRVVAYGKTSAGKVYDSDSYALLKTATKTKTPTLSKVTTTKGKAVLTHTNVSGETGYTVYYSTKKDSGFKKYANFKSDTTTCNITKLISGKTYYFKVRTYITTDSGYVYSAWSNIKSVKVK